MSARLAVSACLLLTAASAFAADPPAINVVMKFAPAQRGVEYDVPKQADWKKCKVDTETIGKTTGWVVYGPEGQVIRRFTDSDGDGTVDMWRYYQHGLEVYRDMDTNRNNKVDQSRWLNTGGTRWGIDRNEDRRIDEWKMISAHEAAYEAIQALLSGDSARLSPLLTTKDDLETLGMNEAISKKVMAAVDSPKDKLRAAARKLGARSKWLRFDVRRPCVVPADQGKASKDLTVFDNAMAIVESGGKPGLIQLGEMIKVGNTWKFTQVPQPIAGAQQVTFSPTILTPEVNTPGANLPTASLTPEVQKLLADLRKLDDKAPGINSTRKDFVNYNLARVRILRNIVAKVPAKDRGQWQRQIFDGLAAATQTGAYPEGIKVLTAERKAIMNADPKSPLVAYATYRLLLQTYNNQLRIAKPDQRGNIQEWFLGQLEAFATNYPKSDDAPEAMLQLGNTYELYGKGKDARKWYAKLSSSFPKTPAGERATGALRRFDLEGKRMDLTGTSPGGGKIDVSKNRGRVTLVVFWATWSKPFTDELPQLVALEKKYRSKGFTIVGVNLDSNKAAVAPYERQHRIGWTSIREQGGLDSAPAQKYGIIAVPTMFLIGKNGLVVNRNISVEQLKKDLPATLIE